MCDGGVDPDPLPDQLYPGQITVPAGCNCRTCHGCTFVDDPRFADIVVCQCRRCACKSTRRNDLSPLITRAEAESSPKSCCGSRKIATGKSDISPTINSPTEIEREEDQVVNAQEIDIPVIAISTISGNKDRSPCCGS
jgi:hypothetical protein